jgi:hypothetical protein
LFAVSTALVTIADIDHAPRRAAIPLATTMHRGKDQEIRFSYQVRPLWSKRPRTRKQTPAAVPLGRRTSQNLSTATQPTQYLVTGTAIDCLSVMNDE